MRLLVIQPDGSASRLALLLALWLAGWCAVTYGIAELTGRWQVWPISAGIALLSLAALSTWAMMLDLTAEAGRELNARTDAVARQGAGGVPVQGR